jgi:hypothetical protein
MNRRTAAIAVICGLIPGTAGAEAQVRGYLLGRFQMFPPARDALLYPALELEEYQGFVEANLDLTLKTDRLTVRSDTSALYRVAPSGCRPGGDLPACMIINELYLTADVVADHLIVIAGRHRPSWGTALSYHPVEPMNPPPDPLDPGFQRLGAWTAMAELSGERYVATAAWFPTVSHSEVGTPEQIESGLAGGRVAWRPPGFDVSAIGFYDIALRLPAYGAAASVVLGDLPFEVHGEGLVHQRRALDAGTLQAGTCPVRDLGLPRRDVWDYSAIAGARWDQGDGTLVNLEYLHNGDGLVRGDFQTLLARADQLRAMCPEARLEPADTSEVGRPQQLPGTLLRRSYAILSAVKPRLTDEGLLSNVGLAGAVVAGLDDMSGVASGRVIFTVRQAMVIRVGGLVRFGDDRSQYGILPFRSELLAELQFLF